mgnify:CR=1 FL=1
MSALALYYRFKGKEVCGYDRTPSDITEMLSQKDIAITFSEDLDFIPKDYTPENTLVVYTPAIPKEHKQLVYFQTHGYKVCKRSEVLGLITEDSFCLAVAGTHGKTTTSSILAHILVECKAPVSAFLGGICENFQSNFICKGTELTVVEADEFDRSFLRLSPSIACITAVDADHLDIYGTAEEFQKGFEDFTHRLKPGGKLIVRRGLPFAGLTYGIADGSDYEISQVRIQNGGYLFTLSYTDPKTGNREEVKDCSLFRPGEHHLLNALAAVAVAHQAGYPLADLARALASFKGVKRRFSYIINTPEQVFIDDYAHHPTELNALYIFIHIFFHWLHWGVGFRQYTDWLLYLEAHRPELDNGRFTEMAQQLDILYPMQLFAQAAIRHLGAAPELFPIPLLEEDDPHSEAILLDVLRGGNFGFGQRPEPASNVWVSNWRKLTFKARRSRRLYAITPHHASRIIWGSVLGHVMLHLRPRGW